MPSSRRTGASRPSSRPGCRRQDAPRDPLRERHLACRPRERDQRHRPVPVPECLPYHSSGLRRRRAPVTVTYDTSGSGLRYRLRRNGVNLADFVTLQNVFDYAPPVPGTSSRQADRHASDQHEAEQRQGMAARRGHGPSQHDSLASLDRVNPKGGRGSPDAPDDSVCEELPHQTMQLRLLLPKQDGIAMIMVIGMLAVLTIAGTTTDVLHDFEREECGPEQGRRNVVLALRGRPEQRDVGSLEPDEQLARLRTFCLRARRLRPPRPTRTGRRSGTARSIAQPPSGRSLRLVFTTTRRAQAPRRYGES